MVSIVSLWLPILLSAVAVFVASSVIHMFLKYHSSDYGKVPAEDEVMEALRKFNIPPGDYLVPHAGSPEGMKDPAFQEKMKKGPVLMMTVMHGFGEGMGKMFVQWFLFSVVVGICAAYISGRALSAGAPYLSVHRFAGATAFYCYSLGLIPTSIWYHKSWTATLKSVFDGLVYGLLTGGNLRLAVAQMTRI